ncbi:MAG: flagellar biosynthetic protein FliQ [Polyangiales bacterium]
MTPATALDWFRLMLWTATLTAGPVVLTVVVVGFVIAIFQAATQVNDQAVAFGPKAIAIVLVLAISGAWMLQQTGNFARAAFSAIAKVHR